MELLVKGCLLMGRLVIGTYSNGHLDVWSYWILSDRLFCHMEC